jgi:hypothetical protein
MSKAARIYIAVTLVVTIVFALNLLFLYLGARAPAAGPSESAPISELITDIAHSPRSLLVLVLFIAIAVLTVIRRLRSPSRVLPRNAIVLALTLAVIYGLVIHFVFKF